MYAAGGIDAPQVGFGTLAHAQADLGGVAALRVDHAQLDQLRADALFGLQGSGQQEQAQAAEQAVPETPCQALRDVEWGCLHNNRPLQLRQVQCGLGRTVFALVQVIEIALITPAVAVLLQTLVEALPQQVTAGQAFRKQQVALVDQQG